MVFEKVDKSGEVDIIVNVEIDVDVGVKRFCKVEGAERKFMKKAGGGLVCTNCRFAMNDEKEVEKDE